MSEVLDRIDYFYRQQGGTYNFPNSAEGDLLKICKLEIEQLRQQLKEERGRNEKVLEALEFYSYKCNWSPHPEYENACCFDSADFGTVARQAIREQDKG